MCENCEYNYFPAQTIGGPTGDYFVDVPVPSNRYTEFQVVQISNGAQAAQVYVTGDNDKPAQVVYDGSKVLTDQTFLRGLAFNVPASTTIMGNRGWERVTHSQDRVFARIDSAADKSCYVTIRFRVRLITIIPGPAETVHPDLGHQMNIQRADNIRQRLAKAGIPARALENA